MLRVLRLSAALAFLCFSAKAAEPLPSYVSSRETILKATAPDTFRQRLKEGRVELPLIGSAHVSGRYHFTRKPYLIEGAEKLQELGYPGVKLWLTNPETAYPFHSDWADLGKNPSLLQMIRHPLYQQALKLPFEAIALEVQNVRTGKPGKPGHSVDPASDFADDETQVYELAKDLLTTFKDRDVTFILQNWEGDWMFRGGARESWEKGNYPDLAMRTDAFVRWFAARQRGVDRATAEVPASKAKVLHAIEVNKVLDTWKGIPTLTSEVLPKVKVDLISWSCYDGLQSWKKSANETAIGIFHGLETIRHFAKRGAAGTPAFVMLGEIGVAERKGGYDETSVAAVFDGALAASATSKVSHIFFWQLYCNEVTEGQPKEQDVHREDQLNGFWLVKPDGTLSHTGRYLDTILKVGRPAR
jgi:hypothetical protein